MLLFKYSIKLFLDNDNKKTLSCARHIQDSELHTWVRQYAIGHKLMLQKVYLGNILNQVVSDFQVWTQSFFIIALYCFFPIFATS